MAARKKRRCTKPFEVVGDSDEEKPSFALEEPEEAPSPLSEAISPMKAIPDRGPHPFAYYKSKCTCNELRTRPPGIRSCKATLEELFGAGAKDGTEKWSASLRSFVQSIDE